MGLCRSRAAPVRGAEANKVDGAGREQPGNKDAILPKTAPKIAVEETSTLPRPSLSAPTAWNLEAKPFMPQQGNELAALTKALADSAQRAPPGLAAAPGQVNRTPLQAKASTSLRQRQQLQQQQSASPQLESRADDPEWLQYLSKKCQTLRKERPAVTPSGAGRPRTSARMREAMNSGDAKVGEDGAAKTNIVLPTSVYLQLLKEGNGNSSKAGKLRRGEQRSTDKTAKPQTLEGTLANGGRDPSKQGESTATSAAGSLKKLWDSSMKEWPATSPVVPSAVVDTPEGQVEVVPAKPLAVKDDGDVGRSMQDVDLTEPAYWSECECSPVGESRAAALARPSAHRTQRMAAATARSYVMQDLSVELDQAVGKMLYQLQELSEQSRSLVPEGGSWRRFNIGLKEVFRQMKRMKVQCLIVAPDIEESAAEGGLDDRIREVLAFAYQRNIPVIFALSRARLGMALGKNLRISLVGVVDSAGARAQVEEAIRHAEQLRTAWLERH